MKKCPYCQETTRQNQASKTSAGLQRYRRMHDGRKYTPEPKPQGYSESLRKRAAEMYVDGMNLGKIARHLKVHHRTFALWVADHAEALPNAPLPEDVQDAEMDELFAFIANLYPRSAVH